jgi:predicted ester cyclase
MSESNKALARRFVEEVWSADRYELIDELLAPDFVSHATASGEPFGRDEMHRLARQFREAFPQGRFVLDDLIAEGDRVAYRWSLDAVHGGPFMGVAATGRRVRFTGINLVRVAGSRIVEQWRAVNAYQVLEQLGAVPGRS